MSEIMINFATRRKDVCKKKQQESLYGNQTSRVYPFGPYGVDVPQGYEARIRLHRKVERGQVEPDQYADEQ